MTEGWWNGAYYVLFDPQDAPHVDRVYGFSSLLPGMIPVGLKFWDDLLILDTATGEHFSVPTVPLDRRHLQPEPLVPTAASLQPDARLQGRIRWFVTPLVFGGDPKDAANTIWVSMEQHGQLVRWWNAKYQELRRAKG